MPRIKLPSADIEPLFTISVPEAGSTQVPLGNGPLYAGLAVCSHLANVVETVVFSDVAIEVLPPAAKKAK
ncbi:MAG: hypothetical protein NTW86_10765 [Candidatus Sumerlaeota bacterium]|nr:hypothetical protein [Candidatus Sumerlaeota bacterium]